MRWVRDGSGRFPRRPHFAAEELEEVCADLVAELCQVRGCADPLSVDDLSVLIETRAADLDLYAADLPSGVDAVTDFVAGARPRVRVGALLSSQKRYVTRLRMTLAHEVAHVVLHNFIWWFDAGAAFDPAALSPRCGPRAAGVDWMEWQANYAAGALLMPSAAVRALLGSAGPAWQRSSRASRMIAAVQERFAVSSRAAKVRLEQLGYVTQRPPAILRAPTPRWRA